MKQYLFFPPPAPHEGRGARFLSPRGRLGGGKIYKEFWARIIPIVIGVFLLGCAEPEPVQTSFAPLPVQQTPTAVVLPTPMPTATPNNPSQPFAEATMFGQGRFVDVTELVGVTAVRLGQDKLIGQAWGDYDNDGWLDFYVTDPRGSNKLFRNDGDGTFTLASLSGSVSLPAAISSGAVFADYDNDGWADLLVLNQGENVLFHNENGTGFTDVTETAGLLNSAHSKTAAWGDFDNDGYIDLYIANWSCSPNCGRPVEGDRDRLFRNKGDGTFRDMTSFLRGDKTRGAGFVGSFVDYDNDGDLDIYLVNDEFINPVGNGLWRNDGFGCGGWCWVEVSEETGSDTQLMGMGLAMADYDNDGDMDFYFSNAGPMTLLQNVDGRFRDVAPVAGVDLGLDAIGWGAVFLDYDNDGWQDLYLALSDMVSTNEPRNPLFRNNGDGTFSDVAMLTGLMSSSRTLGVATADYDQDGRIDMLVGNFEEGYRLYHNESINNHNSITVRLIGGGGVNRDAIGARVQVVTADGRSQLRDVQAGSSLGAGNALELYFGLGDQTTVSELTIFWPDGMIQRFSGLAVNGRYEFTHE